MARRRSRRYRKRSGRWSANLQRIHETVSASGGWFNENYTLASNPMQSILNVSQVFTAKNFELTFNIEPQNMSAAKFIEDLCAYIMYVPQGMTIDSDYAKLHPEYILAYKYIGSPTGITYAYRPSGNDMYEAQQFQPIRMRTRLSRKLQTGDQIVLFINGYNEGTASELLELSGIVRWWSKAN